MLLTASCGANKADEQSEISEIVSVFSEEESGEAAVERDTLNLVALGDSIPRGYGLSAPDTQSFPAQVGTHFSGIYKNVDINNYAVDGMTSGELVELLKSNKAEMVSDADVIMICIGANNILRHAYELLYVGNINAEALFIAYAQFMLGNKSNKAAADALSDYFGAVTEYAGSKEYTDKMEDGAEQLRADIPIIISEIRSVNADALIYFTTIYNPYKGMNLSLQYVDNPFNLDDLSESFVGRINQVINESAEENEYNICDIYTLFKNDKGNNINSGINIAGQNISYDPHPNLKGHTLIADEYKKVITEDLAR